VAFPVVSPARNISQIPLEKRWHFLRTFKPKVAKCLFVNISEISYLQLTLLDLSGNRISSLPVELRFMTSVVHLSLDENPLTCPPANVRVIQY
jgi:Leucine-rich repeat (LRR) protein